jgi:hypothetical protein
MRIRGGLAVLRRAVNPPALEFPTGPRHHALQLPDMLRLLALDVPAFKSLDRPRVYSRFDHERHEHDDTTFLSRPPHDLTSSFLCKTPASPAHTFLFPTASCLLSHEPPIISVSGTLYVFVGLRPFCTLRYSGWYTYKHDHD